MIKIYVQFSFHNKYKTQCCSYQVQVWGHGLYGLTSSTATCLYIVFLVGFYTPLVYYMLHLLRVARWRTTCGARCRRLIRTGGHFGRDEACAKGEFEVHNTKKSAI